MIRTFTAIWNQLDTNRQVGGLFPNDGDSNAWGDPNIGFPQPFAAANVAKTPLVGGQWRLKDGGGYDLVIVYNSDHPNIPTGGSMQVIV